MKQHRCPPRHFRLIPLNNKSKCVCAKCDWFSLSLHIHFFDKLIFVQESALRVFVLYTLLGAFKIWKYGSREILEVHLGSRGNFIPIWPLHYMSEMPLGPTGFIVQNFTANHIPDEFLQKLPSISDKLQSTYFACCNLHFYSTQHHSSDVHRPQNMKNSTMFNKTFIFSSECKKQWSQAVHWDVKIGQR